MRRLASFRLAALGLAALLAGCAGSPKSTILTLDAAPPAAPARADYRGPAVAIPAVHLPAALDRAEFVREGAAATLAVDDFARWGAPLGLLARDALTRDLAARLPAGKVLPSGTAGGGPGTATLAVTVVAFDAGPSATRLEAAWRTLPAGPPMQATLAASGAATPAETAQRLGELLGQLADRIAAGLPAGGVK